MGVIFDLDQTLIDTSIANAHRKNRQWQTVYGLIPKFTLYPGIVESLDWLKENKVPSCIVTSSISNYCDRILQHWKIPIIHKVCYHDTIKKKPNPEPIQKALEIIKTAPHKTLSLGDRDIDIIASNSANVISVACLWGADNPQSLIKTNPQIILSYPDEMIALFEGNFRVS